MSNKENNYSNYTYTVCKREGFQLSEALSLWKAKFKEFKDFEKDVITHEGLKDFSDFVQECWNDIQPVTVEKALGIGNTEERRIYFDCIGVETLMKELNPTLRDRQVIKKKRTKWDDNNDPLEYEFEDVYELYEIEGKKLFEVNKWGQEPNPVFAVRCWCTTTNREYWIYVSTFAATGHSWISEYSIPKYDAISAIAWTIRIDVIKPEKIYRQGDIIVVKKSDVSEDTSQYHLCKENYLDLMYSET